MKIYKDRLATLIELLGISICDDLKHASRMFAAFNVAIDEAANALNMHVLDLIAYDYTPSVPSGVDPELQSKVTKVCNLVYAGEYRNGLKAAKSLGLTEQGLVTVIKYRYPTKLHLLEDMQLMPEFSGVDFDKL